MGKSRQTGLTVTELLVVLGILAVMFTISVPLFKHAGTWPLRAAAAELAGHIRESRTRAIVESHNCYLVFYEFSAKYKLDRLSGDPEWITLPEEISYCANNFPLVDRRPTLYFKYTGAPNSGGHVGFKDRAGNKLYIIVTPVTGRVRIDKAPP